MTDRRNHTEPEPESDQRPRWPHVLDAAQLFQGAREVWIELHGVRYRLRITRRKKLILQK